MNDLVLELGAAGVRDLWTRIEENDACSCNKCFAAAVIEAVGALFAFERNANREQFCSVCGLVTADTFDHDWCWEDDDEAFAD